MILAVAKKDKGALKVLYEKYNKKVFRFAFKLLNDYEASQDVTSEVFLSIWEKAGSYKGHSRVSTWIFGIAHNKIREVWRKRKRTEIANLYEKDAPIEVLSKYGAKYDFAQAFEALPPTQKEVVEMIFYLGLSYEEAANLLNCPEGTVKSRVFSARKNLKAFLSEPHVERRMR